MSAVSPRGIADSVLPTGLRPETLPTRSASTLSLFLPPVSPIRPSDASSTPFALCLHPFFLLLPARRPRGRRSANNSEHRPISIFYWVLSTAAFAFNYQPRDVTRAENITAGGFDGSTRRRAAARIRNPASPRSARLTGAARGDMEKVKRDAIARELNAAEASPPDRFFYSGRQLSSRPIERNIFDPRTAAT